MSLNRDVLSWNEVVSRLNVENNELKTVIQDLEDKNKRLVGKLNEQIMNKATEYKQKTL